MFKYVVHVDLNVGCWVGKSVGCDVGDFVVGCEVGDFVGTCVGCEVGDFVGVAVGGSVSTLPLQTYASLS